MTKSLSWIAGVGIPLVAALFVIDARYLHVDAFAGEEQSQQRIHSDISRELQLQGLRTELKLNQLRLSLLASKSKLTTDEKEEVEWTRNQNKVLQQRILELQSK